MPSANVSETSIGAPVHTNGRAASAEPENSIIANNDISTFRRFVPLVSEGTVTYLNASFAPPSNIIVHEAITRYASEALYNPMPKPTWQATMKDVRQLLARYINTDPSNIALTRDTTEALGSIIRGLRFKPGDNVVILDSEHPNHAYQWMSLRSAGLQVRQVPTIEADKKAGKVKAANAETFSPYVDDRTIAVGLSSIMFHSGQWNDVADICSTFRSKGIHVIADITQQVGFATVDVQALGVSAAAFSLHKGLHCPTGLAALYVDPDVIRDVDPTPPIVGYGAVSNVRADLLVPEDPIVYHPSAQRYDHLNLSLVSGVVAKAYLSFYLDVLNPKAVENHLYALGDILKHECESLGISIVGPDSSKEHAPHLYVLDLHDERWMPHLRDNGIIVTSYRLGIRVSFGFYNNTQDVKNLATILRTGIEAGIHLPKTSC
ncbi:Ff.00g084940.m01.CDS01 [Fusarium sp. VM40]|nr:Ff.00g084940.m01.CDS01 [Fusarium sp. VM40]